MEDFSIWRKVIGWAILWYTSYRFVKRFNSTKCPEYSCRIITVIHAIIITVINCKLLFFSGTWPFDMLGLPNNPIEIDVISVSLGYFFYDFIWCLHYNTEGPIMLIHHMISIVTMSISLWMGVSGVEVLATIFGSEISTIFLDLRWFIKYHKMHDTTVGITNDILFVLLFVGFRIFLGGYLAYCELLSPAPIIMKLGGSCMYLVNCVFLFQVLSFARYKAKKLLFKQPSKPTFTTSEKESKPEMNGHTNGNAAGDMANGVRYRSTTEAK
ncbi:TLC domain-containing protein 5-like [Styela clava]